MITSVMEKHGNGVDIGTARDDALRRLEEVCMGRGTRLTIKEHPTEYFVYREDRKEIILSPSASEEHINLLTLFLLT